MAKQDAKNKLTVKVSHADMLAYTDTVYDDMDDPAINGIAAHALDESPHNLPARFAAVQDQINDISDELAGKLGSGDISLDGKADVAGDTFTGPVIFTGGDEKIILDGPEQTDRSIVAKTGGARRWEVGVASNDDEQGANSGSNFVVSRYADNGNFAGIPFAIDRKTGITYIDQLQIGGGDVLVGDGIDIRLQEEEPTENLGLGTVWLRPSGTTVVDPIGILPQSGLISHIAASNVTASDGELITSVNDLSSANNPAAGVNGGPRYLTNKTPNGSPVLSGTESDGYLNLSPTLYNGKTSGHVFLYYATVALSATFPIGISSSTQPTFISDTLGASADNYDLVFLSQQQAYPAAASPRPVLCWRIYEARHDGTRIKNYFDGTLQRDAAYGWSPGSGGFLLRSRNTNAGKSHMIADFIAYDRALTTQEAADVRQYLIDKNGTTGPIKDEQYEAVMDLSPIQYLPLTEDFNDYSGNGFHGTPQNGSLTIGVIPQANKPVSVKGSINPGGNNIGIATQCPNWTMNNLTEGNSWSWWSTREVDGTYGSWSHPDMYFGSNLFCRWNPGGLEVVVNNQSKYTHPVGSKNTIDHYVLTISFDVNRPARLYINGALVATFYAEYMPTPSGNSTYLEGGNLSAGATTQYGGHIAVFSGKVLTPEEVFNLHKARTIEF